MHWLRSRLRTRVGVALGLAVVVAAAVAIGKVAGSGEDQPSFAVEPAPYVTANPTVGDDGVVEPSPSPHADDEAITAAAAAFVRAWLRRDLSAAEWNSAIATLTTPTLASDLKGVDPKTVPATRQAGPPKIASRMATYARVSVAMDTGTLTLKIFKEDDRWLVGEIDWERS